MDHVAVVTATNVCVGTAMVEERIGTVGSRDITTMSSHTECRGREEMTLPALVQLYPRRYTLILVIIRIKSP